MESHHVADDIAPSQISSSWGGFATRTDWKSSDPTTARQRPTSHPPDVRARYANRIGAPRQSPRLARTASARVVVFFGGGKGDDFDGLADIYVPTDGCSADRPVKSLLPQSMLTHLPSSSTHSRCVIRDAPRAQSDSRSWTLFSHAKLDHTERYSASWAPVQKL